MHLGDFIFFYWVLSRGEEFLAFLFLSSSQRVPQEVPNDISILSHIREIC
jgi:hypothetical protein